MLDLGDFQTMCILGLVKYVWRKSSENIWWWCHAVLDVPKSHCQEERNCRQANENGCQSICQEIQKLGNIKGESRVYIKCILHLGNVERSDKPHFHLHPYNAGALNSTLKTSLILRVQSCTLNIEGCNLATLKIRVQQICTLISGAPICTLKNTFIFTGATPNSIKGGSNLHLE